MNAFDGRARSVPTISRLSGAMVNITAGGDISSEGTQIRGDRGVLVSATGSIDLYEARDTHSQTHSVQSKTSSLNPASLGKSNASDSVTTWSDTAVKGSVQSAQGGVSITGGAPVTIQGTDLQAGGNLSVRGSGVSITGAMNYSGSTSEHSSKGPAISLAPLRGAAEGWNARKNETVTQSQSELVRTELSGANVKLQAQDASGKLGDVLLAGTTIDTPGTFAVQADKLLLGTQQTQSSTSTSSAKRDIVWQKTREAGSVDQDTQYVQINAGKLDLQANKISAELGARDSVQQLATQPGMGWVNQLANDPKLAGKVDWPRVEEAHQSWDYKQQGLTPEGAAIVTAVVSYLSWGTLSELGAAVGNSAAAGVGAAAGGTVATAVGGAVTAGLSALATQATLALINNQGNLGGALHDLGSSASVHNLLTAIVTGGALGALNLNPTGLPTVGGGAEQFMSQLGTNLAAGAARAVIGTAINGGSLEDSLREGLKNALLDTVAAQGANWIGDNFDGLANKLAHAIAGCAVGAARTDGSCAAGALGAAIGEIAAEGYGRRPDTVQFAAMVSGIAAAVAGGDATQINLASQAGANAAANNYLNHDQWKQLTDKLAQCNQQPGGCTHSQEAQIQSEYQRLSAEQDKGLKDACASPGSALCRTLLSEAQQGSAAQLALVSSGALPDYYAAGLDFNNNVRLAQQRVDAYDILSACNANPQQCNQQRLDGAVRLVTAGVSVAALTAFSIELGAVGAGIAAEGAATYCATRIQQCLNLVNGLAEMASGVPYSGMSMTSLNRRIPAGYTAVEMSGLPARTMAIADTSTGEIRLLTSNGNIIDVPPAPLPPWSSAADNGAVKIVWGKSIRDQGMPWEDYLASQMPASAKLPDGFKTFDFFDRSTGVATSAKASRISNPSQVYSTIKGYVDDAASFERAQLDRAVVSKDLISERRLSIAVPASTTPSQWQQIQRAVEYGQSQGVKVVVTGVR